MAYSINFRYLSIVANSEAIINFANKIKEKENEKIKDKEEEKSRLLTQRFITDKQKITPNDT